MRTDVAGISMGLAAVEVRIAAQAAAFAEASSREEERIRRLDEKVRDTADRLNDKIESLDDKLDERHDNTKATQQAILQKLDDIIETLRPMEKRIEELEHTKSKATGMAAAVGGGTVALSGVIAWLTDLLGK